MNTSEDAVDNSRNQTLERVFWMILPVGFVAFLILQALSPPNPISSALVLGASSVMVVGVGYLVRKPLQRIEGRGVRIGVSIGVSVTLGLMTVVAIGGGFLTGFDRVILVLVTLTGFVGLYFSFFAVAPIGRLWDWLREHRGPRQ